MPEPGNTTTLVGSTLRVWWSRVSSAESIRKCGVLKSQGLWANQSVTFLTDGGEEVRALTELITPEAEHVLDWFHITMRLTVLSQLRPLFERWYPGLANDNANEATEAIAA